MSRKKKDQQLGDELLESNRRARHEYEILEELEAGIALQGSEVKSVREGRVSLKEAYCQFKNGELFLLQAHIAEFPQAHARNHAPLRARKLLLHRRELDHFDEAVQQQGLTIVPLAMYVKGRRVKLLIGLAKGRKMYDKREVERERSDRRDIERAMSRRR